MEEIWEYCRKLDEEFNKPEPIIRPERETDQCPAKR